MSVEKIKEYAEILIEALKTKDHTPLLKIFQESFEAKATLMGRSYHFDEKEKFSKFLGSLPANISVDIRDIKESSEGRYTIQVKMGMGMLKIPSQWEIGLEADNNKISYFEIK